MNKMFIHNDKWIPIIVLVCWQKFSNFFASNVRLFLIFTSFCNKKNNKLTPEMVLNSFDWLFILQMKKRLDNFEYNLSQDSSVCSTSARYRGGLRFEFCHPLEKIGQLKVAQKLHHLVLWLYRLYNNHITPTTLALSEVHFSRILDLDLKYK